MIVEVPVNVPSVPVIVTVPLGVAVLCTVTRPVLLTVACVVSLELQVTDEVIFVLLWSVAVSCCVPPGTTVAEAGVTVNDVVVLTSKGAVTVTLPEVAVIVAEPRATPVARPAWVMVAIPAFEELQFTRPVTSCVWLFPRVPEAVNCVVAPGATNPLVGEMVMETISLDEGKKSPQLVEIATTIRMQTRAAKADLVSNFILEARFLSANSGSGGMLTHFRRRKAVSV